MTEIRYNTNALDDKNKEGSKTDRATASNVLNGYLRLL